MSAVSSLVPARFLTIVAHLVIVITIFWSRENNVKACLPLEYTQEQYDTEDKKLVVALAVTLGLFAIELAGFFSGVSMFNCSQGLLCILNSVTVSLIIGAIVNGLYFYNAFSAQSAQNTTYLTHPFTDVSTPMAAMQGADCSSVFLGVKSFILFGVQYLAHGLEEPEV